MLLQRSNDFAVVLLARLAFGRNHQRIQAALASGRDPRRVGLVRDDDGDPCIGNAARVNTVRNGDEVRTASGEEYAEGMHALISDF